MQYITVIVCNIFGEKKKNSNSEGIPKFTKEKQTFNNDKYLTYSEHRATDNYLSFSGITVSCSLAMTNPSAWRPTNFNIIQQHQNVKNNQILFLQNVLQHYQK